MKQSQASVDFLIILGIALAVFLFIFTVADKRTDEAQRATVDLYVKEATDRIATELNAVFLAGDGTTKIIPVSAVAKDGTALGFTIYPTAHLLKTNYSFQGTVKQYSTTLITANISGSISAFTSDLNVTHVNGGLVIQ